MIQFPETGYLRLSQIIGREAVSEEQAEKNRREGRGPVRSKPAIPPLLPVSRSTWWAGVRSGRFPKPVRFGARCTRWRVDDIRALLSRGSH